jgi:hypothetical protein
LRVFAEASGQVVNRADIAFQQVCGRGQFKRVTINKSYYGHAARTVV